MRTVLSGATGFLGRPLVAALRADGHEVAILTRQPGGSPAHVQWDPDGSSAGAWARTLDGADVVVNLAGEPIAGKRWTLAHKARIRDSRLLATRSIAAAIRQAARPPRLLINGSGVGYYGSRGDEVVTENSSAGTDFLADVCRAWEAEAVAAERVGTRVALVRTGIVLEREGGALEQIARPFQFFVGGPLGSGRQYMPWIHREDWIGLVRFIMASEECGGAFNGTAPAPVTNEAFTRSLARAMRRPAIMRAPAFALKIALGEMAEPLLLTGQRAVPARALAAGFVFQYPTLDEALRAIFRAGARGR